MEPEGRISRNDISCACLRSTDENTSLVNGRGGFDIHANGIGQHLLARAIGADVVTLDDQRPTKGDIDTRKTAAGNDVAGPRRRSSQRIVPIDLHTDGTAEHARTGLICANIVPLDSIALTAQDVDPTSRVAGDHIAGPGFDPPDELSVPSSIYI